jgi:hypothetical protein
MPNRRDVLTGVFAAATGAYGGMAVSDRPDFERQQDISNQSLSEVDTAVQTEPGVEVVQLTELRSSTLSSGVPEFQTFRPPPGTVFEKPSIRFIVDSPGGGGSHTIRFGTGTGASIAAFQGDYPAGDPIQVERNTPLNPGLANSLYPANPQARIANINGVRADNNNPLQFQYTNAPGSSQTNTREYRVFVKRRQIA